MQNTDESQVNPPEPRETVVTGDNQDPLDLITDPEELRKAAKAQRAMANRYKNKPTDAPTNQTTREVSITNQTPKPLDILRGEEFRLFRQGYNEDEIDLIIRNGGSKILEDKGNPITLGLKAAKEQRLAEDAAGKTADSASLSEVERKYTPEQLKNMTPSELEKILPHA